MSDDSIKAKALALLNEVLTKKGFGDDCRYAFIQPENDAHQALCRAIEQHEAFKQEVSDAVVEYKADQPYVWKQSVSDYFCRFIISKPKPDPLAEVLLEELAWDEGAVDEYAGHIRAKLEARGFEIREKG